eukprot:134361_1
MAGGSTRIPFVTILCFGCLVVPWLFGYSASTKFRLLLAVVCWVVLWIAYWMLTLFLSDSSGPNIKFRPSVVGNAAGVYTMQGRRAHSEDAYHARLMVDGDSLNAFYGVFDGHGGSRASAFTAEKLFDRIAAHPKFLSDPEEAVRAGYQQIDSDFLELAARHSWEDGTTANTALILNRKLYVGNCGDSRAILVRGGVATALTSDHKPNSDAERRRIEQAGGRVLFLGTWRVAGILAVARAIGDRHLKQWVIPDPDVLVQDITKEDDFIILATDGLWDVLSNQQAANCFLSALKSSKGDLNRAAEALAKQAYNDGSLDNITVLVVDLSKYR